MSYISIKLSFRKGEKLKKRAIKLKMKNTLSVTLKFLLKNLQTLNTTVKSTLFQCFPLIKWCEDTQVFKQSSKMSIRLVTVLQFSFLCSLNIASKILERKPHSSSSTNLSFKNTRIKDEELKGELKNSNCLDKILNFNRVCGER